MGDSGGMPGYHDDDSIVITIKKMLGVDLDYDVFNTDIIVLINSAFMTLTQLGVGPKEGFVVTDYNTRWSDFLTNKVKLEAAKQYIYLKVKSTFDPPSSSAVMNAYEKQIQELEWRLNVQAESVEEFDFMKDSTNKYGTSESSIKPSKKPKCSNSNVHVSQSVQYIIDPDTETLVPQIVNH